MKIDKKFKGLVKEDFRYVFYGDIETTESLEIDLDMGLFVTGRIKAGESIKAGGSIEAGWSIKAGESIEAGGSIESGGSIKAGWSIQAGESIKAGGSIKAGESIEAGGSIEAHWSIQAGESIKAGESIEAGGSYGIVAGLSITCKTTLSFGLRLFAGTCNWRKIVNEDKTITCGKLENGTIEYGILKETGLKEKVEGDDKTEEAMKLLKEQGYRIVKI
jgi:hypothetical protein